LGCSPRPLIDPRCAWEAGSLGTVTVPTEPVLDCVRGLERRAGIPGALKDVAGVVLNPDPEPCRNLVYFAPKTRQWEWLRLLLPGLSPYAFSLGPIHVHWYSIFMVVSIGLGLLYLMREGERRGYDVEALSDVALWAIVGGVVGARLAFVIFNVPGWFVADPLQILRIWDGGLSWHGAVGGGAAAAWLALRNRPGPRVEELLDLAVPGISIGIILVRIGNIFNHEVLGRATLYFPGGRWPAQLVGCAIGLFLLIRYLRAQANGPQPVGVAFWSFVFWYSLLRGVFEESLRQSPFLFVHDFVPGIGVGFLTVLQVFTPFILAVSLVLWRRALLRGWRSGAGVGRVGSIGTS
jgi:phosphatidylglycerol:prolipoprotein diacylglycerol transferase